jgi:hypothetical protein
MSFAIPKLTKEEIQTLQVDAALRLMGDLTTMLTELNCDLGFAISELGKARVAVEKLKADKSTVVEILRALKVIVHNG